MAKISLSDDLLKQLHELKRPYEMDEQIIERIYELTHRHLLMEYLYDTSDAIPVKQALAEAKKIWNV